jgi:hypothetical protein
MSEQDSLFEGPKGRGFGHGDENLQRIRRRRVKVWVRKGCTPEQFRRRIEAILEAFKPLPDSPGKESTHETVSKR